MPQICHLHSKHTAKQSIRPQKCYFSSENHFILVFIQFAHNFLYHCSVLSHKKHNHCSSYFVLFQKFIFSILFSSTRSLPARRRPSGLVVSGVCLSVCLSVCLCVCAHCFCPQDISRTGSWITTKFGGWEQGVNL